MTLLFRWRVGILWYVLALAGPALLMLIALAVSKRLDFASVPWPGTEVALSRFAAAFGVYLVLNTEEIARRG